MKMIGKRFEQLDALRFFAVAFVMIQHFVPLGHIDQVIRPGMFGVDLFFVISGFLITGILLDNRKDLENPSEIPQVAARFYIRRFLRIFPAYYLLCAVLLITGLKAMKDTWPWQIFYLSDV